MTARRVRIGTAGWSIPRPVADRFPADGSGLERYASVFDMVEINTTFYRPHRASTFERWAASTPDDFRFAVKAPKTVTHERRLVGTDGLMAAFLDQVAPLGRKLGPVLVQLPPSLVFDREAAECFLAASRRLHAGALVLEPRHASWFTPEADALLRDFGAARVAADPAKHAGAERPGGDPALQYYRLHGSPRMYWSSYDDGRLEPLADQLGVAGADAWIVFDNTTSGAAAEDALKLKDLVQA